MVDFDTLKMLYIKKLEEHLKLNKVDKEILHVINLINSSNDYFTTSSCAGRIVLIKVPNDLKKQKDVFIFKSHQIVKFEDIFNVLKKTYALFDNIWFKQEPFIIHVSCRNLRKAIEILKISSKIGLKHSGIISLKKSRVIIEIIGNEKIETILSKNKKIIVSEEYLENLIEEANKKLLRDRTYLGKLYIYLKKYLG
ncbi:MAG: hypothetical protein QXR54_02575, partial [Nanopusillaceae archaeon]